MKIVFLIDVSEYVLHKFSSLKIQVCGNLMRDILIPLVQLIMHLCSLMELLIVENGWQLQVIAQINRKSVFFFWMVNVFLWVDIFNY
jgi:hypothetical protein